MTCAPVLSISEQELRPQAHMPAKLLRMLYVLHRRNVVVALRFQVCQLQVRLCKHIRITHSLRVIKCNCETLHCRGRRSQPCQRGTPL